MRVFNSDACIFVRFDTRSWSRLLGSASIATLGAFLAVSPNNAPRDRYLALFRRNLGLIVSRRESLSLVFVCALVDEDGGGSLLYQVFVFFACQSSRVSRTYIHYTRYVVFTWKMPLPAFVRLASQI